MLPWCAGGPGLENFNLGSWVHGGLKQQISKYTRILDFGGEAEVWISKPMTMLAKAGLMNPFTIEHKDCGFIRKGGVGL